MTHKTSATSVQFLEINANHNGQRIDNFLFSIEKGIPKSRIYRALRKGEVRVNKGRVKQTYKLKIGDVVRVPPLKKSEKTSPSVISDSLEQVLKDSILFEDEALLAINKPSGLAVHAGSEIQIGVIEALRIMRPDAEFLELVHRLDRDTSGCLLLAKTRQSLLNLQQQMLSDTIDKRYQTLLMNHFQQDERLIDKPLRKNTLSSGERMVISAPDGKASKTLFIKRKALSIAQLTEVKLLTGRTHQIRVHSASIGHPVAGDDKYGDRQFNQQLKKFGLKRLFLHAWQLTIHHPVTNDTLTLEAPLPANLAEVIAKLER